MGILAMRRGKLELIIDQKDRPQYKPITRRLQGMIHE
jgi:hypothetical protein